MLFRTAQTRFFSAQFVGSTDLGFTDPDITLTEPTGAGVLSYPTFGSVPNSAILYPTGVGSMNATFIMRAYGWHKCGLEADPDARKVAAATNALPVVIFSRGHGLTSGQLVTVAGCLGNTAANVTSNAVTAIDENTFALNSVQGNGAYAGGGTWSVPALVWMPMPLLEVTCALSSQTGVGTAEVNVNERRTHTIVQTAGFGSTAGLSNEIVSPGNNITGHIILDLKGASKLMLRFNAAGITSANCRVGWI